MMTFFIIPFSLSLTEIIIITIAIVAFFHRDKIAKFIKKGQKEE